MYLLCVYVHIDIYIQQWISVVTQHPKDSFSECSKEDEHRLVS